MVIIMNDDSDDDDGGDEDDDDDVILSLCFDCRVYELCGVRYVRLSLKYSWWYLTFFASYIHMQTR